jgi:nucleoside-diphosphate-sugar epimerase
MGRSWLVIGATGAVGSALVKRLEGEKLRVLVRDALDFDDLFPDRDDIDIFEGDLTEQEDIDEAIDDVDTVLICAGCKLFHWGDLIGHTRRVIKAAEEEVKRVDIVFPSNVTVYGETPVERVKENHPHEALTRKGRIQLNIERCLREANAEGECRTTVARFPSLYGPGVVTTTATRIFGPAVQDKKVSWPGRLDVKREFVYVDDAADAMVRLAKSKRAWGEPWHVSGPEVTTAKDFIRMAFEAAGNDPVMSEITRMRFAARGKVSTDTKEEQELFYLFERPLLLDGTKWTRAFGKVPATPYKEGVRTTVEWWKTHLAKKPKRKKGKKKKKPKR